MIERIYKDPTGVSVAAVESPAIGTTTPVVSPTDVQVRKGEKVYKNSQFRFALAYPEQLAMYEQTTSGTLTVSFQAGAGQEGFQIYVVPFGGTHITSDRFKLDIPSGVFKDQKDTIVGGTPGIMFFSENTIMGETREIWFIRDGFLYEVTTYKELDQWMQNIMQTWRFL